MVRFVIIGIVIAVAFTLYALVDAAMTDGSRARGVSKPVWVVIVVLLPVIGGVLWFMIGKGQTPAAPRVAPDDDPRFTGNRLSKDDLDDHMKDLEARLRELDDEVFPGEDGGRAAGSASAAGAGSGADSGSGSGAASGSGAGAGSASGGAGSGSGSAASDAGSAPGAGSAAGTGPATGPATGPKAAPGTPAPKKPSGADGSETPEPPQTPQDPDAPRGRTAPHAPHPGGKPGGSAVGDETGARPDGDAPRP